MYKRQDSWDTTSQELVTEDPNILNILSSHMELGIFEKVADVVNKERLLGNIGSNTSFLAAYKHFGSLMDKANAFNQDSNTNENIVTKDTNDTQTKDNNLSNIRKSAASSKTSNIKPKKSNQQLKLDDLTKLSDEEFLKLFPSIS